VSEARRLANTKTVRAKPENLPVLNNKLAFIFFVFHRDANTFNNPEWDGNQNLECEWIDARLQLLKRHLPYHESDHVLNLAYNSLLDGLRLQDIELRRNDEAFLDGLGAGAHS